MQVSFVAADGITDHPAEALDGLLARDDGFVWVDVSDYDAAADDLLAESFHAHALVRQACAERNFVPTVHAYESHLFVILHAPLTGAGGHVHVLELDEIIGDRYLVTVHGPRNPVVTSEEATEETRSVRERIVAGRLRPTSAHDLAYAIGSAVARRQSAAVRDRRRPAAADGGAGHGGGLPPARGAARAALPRAPRADDGTDDGGQAHDIQGRIGSLERFVPAEVKRHARDLADQFERVRSLADGELQFLIGVIDLYQTRVTTKMTVAMERLAVIAAITLPVTAIASIYGMNLIANDGTHVVHLLIVLAVMVGISLWLLRWARRQGWW